jgi:hypothetical protein
MENSFTKWEIIFKIADLTIAPIGACVPIWLFFKSKKETKKLEERLKEEIINRKDSENKISKENAEKWNQLYQQEKEMKEKHCGIVIELGKELVDLRKQLSKEGGIPPQMHKISNERKRKEAIFNVESYWGTRSEGGKINKKAINDVLGENWESIFNRKEEEEIIKEWNWLMKKIDDEFKSPKKS